MKLVRKIGLAVIRLSVLSYLIILCIVTLRFKNLELLSRHIKKSNSQIYQDLMIIATCSDLVKLNEFYFVEFGATNGISISNTYLFEKFFGARGIVSEPARIWQKELARNRMCLISSKCVWESSGEKLEFIEATNPDLSGLAGYDGPIKGKEIRETYQVDTISLNDLLLTFEAPKSINFLSIDTEGSELRILSNFDFNGFQFDVIVCEHAYGKNRDGIRRLLESNGYKRKHKFVSFFDDWYFFESMSLK